MLAQTDSLWHNRENRFRHTHAVIFFAIIFHGIRSTRGTLIVCLCPIIKKVKRTFSFCKVKRIPKNSLTCSDSNKLRFCQLESWYFLTRRVVQPDVKLWLHCPLRKGSLIAERTLSEDKYSLFSQTSTLDRPWRSIWFYWGRKHVYSTQKEHSLVKANVKNGKLRKLNLDPGCLLALFWSTPRKK